MAIQHDYHMHSDFSGDCKSKMEDMILASIQKGLTGICFTEHMDMDFPEGNGVTSKMFEVNTDSYLFDLIRLKEKYSEQIQINFGIELGLQPHLSKELAAYAKSYDFDFIIGSSHLANRVDPYQNIFFEGRSEEEAYASYFTSILDNLKTYTNFDIYGHLDYVVRYGPNKNQNYTYEKFNTQLDQILQKLIDSNIGIEANASGLKYGLGEPHPATAVLKRYFELGGEILTIGSDAHAPEHVAYEFDQIADLLKEIGYRYYTTFEHRMPSFHKLL